MHVILQGTQPAGTKFSVPGKHAIAHFLMREWIARDKKIEWAGNQLSTTEIDEGLSGLYTIYPYFKHEV